jgi:hypothetical protein
MRITIVLLGISSVCTAVAVARNSGRVAVARSKYAYIRYTWNSLLTRGILLQ